MRDLARLIVRLAFGGLMARMGAGGRVKVSRVAEIPPEKSGKYRYVVSRADVAAAPASSAVGA